MFKLNLVQLTKDKEKHVFELFNQTDDSLFHCIAKTFYYYIYGVDIRLPAFAQFHVHLFDNDDSGRQPSHHQDVIYHYYYCCVEAEFEK